MLFIEKLINFKWVFKNVQLFAKFTLLGKVLSESHLSEDSRGAWGDRCGSRFPFSLFVEKEFLP